MCHAILRIVYKSDKTVQTVSCDTASAMRTKISELEANEQVVKIGVYVCQQNIELIHEWRAKPYVEEVTQA
jgi:hypothetical protein